MSEDKKKPLSKKELRKKREEEKKNRLKEKSKQNKKRKEVGLNASTTDTSKVNFNNQTRDKRVKNNATRRM